MELSNCCGARVEGLNADNIGRCSECLEGCGMDCGLISAYKTLQNDRIPEGRLQEEIDKLSEQKK